MITRKESYLYLINTEKGERKELIQNIGENFFDEFRLIGFIKEGMDGKWIERWQLTPFGKMQINSYLKFQEIDEELDEICKELDISR